MSEENDTTEEVETTEAEAPAEPEAPTPAAAEPSSGGASAPQLPPKERRRQARAAKAAKAPRRPARSPEERQAERVEIRKQKAVARRAERQRERAKAKADRKPVADVAAREHVPGVQKVRQGVVVSDRADKTITVRIDVARRHRRYQKIVRTSSTLHAHDESNDAHIGDTVVVREARPLSRTKRWRLIEVLERAK
jgi:small subunit ribosomal protein S17